MSKQDMKRESRRVVAHLEGSKYEAWLLYQFFTDQPRGAKGRYATKFNAQFYSKQIDGVPVAEDIYNVVNLEDSSEEPAGLRPDQVDILIVSGLISDERLSRLEEYMGQKPEGQYVVALTTEPKYLEQIKRTGVNLARIKTAQIDEVVSEVIEGANRFSREQYTQN